MIRRNGYFLLTSLTWLSLFGQDMGKLQPLLEPDLNLLKTAIRENIVVRQKNLMAVISSGGSEDLAEAYGHLGQIYQAHGFRKEALIAYGNAALIDPSDVRWHYYHGTVYIEMGELPSAAESLQRLLARAPDNFYGHVRLGHVLLDLNQLEGAAEHLGKALVLQPKSALALYGLGQVFSLQKKHEEAVALFEKALLQQPEASKIHYPLGLAYRRVGNMEKARYYLGNRGTGAIIFPDPYIAEINGLQTASSLYVVLAMAADEQGFSGREFESYILSNLRDKKGVVRYFKDALSYKSTKEPAATQAELARIHFAIAVLREQQGDREKVRASLEQALELDPVFPEALMKLGDIFHREKEHEKAASLYEKALAIDQENRAALEKYAMALLDLNRIKETCVALRRLIDMDPNQAEPRLRLATLIERDDPEGALEQYRVLVGLEMDDRKMAITHGNLAMLMQNKGAPEVAVDHLKIALDLNPEMLETRLNLAAVLGFLNRFQESAAQYALIVARQADHQQARLGELAALVLGHKYSEAILRMEDGLKAMPDSFIMKHLLARMYAAAPDLRLRDGNRALELAGTVFNQRKTLAHAETYAMAMAQSGRFEDAVAFMSKLIANMGEDPGRVAWLKSNLERYKNGQPCCTDYPPDLLLP